MSKIYVVSHAQCTDGWGSINALFKVFGNTAKYFTFGHSESISSEWVWSTAGKKVVVIDYAMPITTWKRVVAVAEQVVTLDHHHSAYMEYHTAAVDIETDVLKLTVEMVESQKVITVFDQSKSGAMLAKCFANLFNAEFTYAELELYKLIQDMDLWIKAYKESEYLYAYIANNAMYADGLRNRCKPLTVEELSKGMTFYSFICENLQQVLTEGKVRYSMFLEQVEKLSQHAETIKLTICDKDKTSLTTYTGMIINANSLFASELGSKLAIKANSFAMIYSIIHGKVKISFRSIKGYDCSEIAKQLGGGGHKTAAACSVDIETLFDILEGKVITAIA